MKAKGNNIGNDKICIDFKRDNRGITLIALILTIIIMLILSGIVLKLLIGENGLITIAKKAREKYDKVSIVENVEIALLDYNTEKMITSEEVDIYDALKKLQEDKIFENILEEDNIGIIKNYEITLAKENDTILIKDIQKIVGTIRIRYNFNQINYTNQNIEIKIKVSGNVVKLIKPGNIDETAIDGKIETTYTVSENGIYIFKVEDTEGNIDEEKIIINKIDKIGPKNFTTEIQNTSNGIKIIAITDDAEANEKNAKSGLLKYEYFVRKEEDEQYTKYETNEIVGTFDIPYSAYAIAYDNAGNKTTSKKYVSDYIKNGLILQLDGINNDIDGHNSNQNTIWYDKSNKNKNATLYNCKVNEDNVAFTGSSYATLDSDALGQYGPSTIEVTFSSNGTSGIVIADNRNVSSRGFGYDGSGFYIKVGDANSEPYFFSLPNDLNSKHTYSVIYDGVNYNNTTAYQDSNPLTKKTSKSSFANNSTYPIIGRRKWASGSAWYFKGNIYSIRVYNRKLSNIQIEHNHELDKNRFNIN